MLTAEIRRKLLDLDQIEEPNGDPVEGLRRLLASTKEDLLTADVFGAIKYLPRVPYLTTLFQIILDRNPHAGDFDHYQADIATAPSGCRFDFWPSYRTAADLPGFVVEPDLVLTAPGMLMFVEAKLHSSFGSQQIERELLTGLDEARGREFFLLIVTPGTRPPRLRCDGNAHAVRDYLHKVAETGQLSERRRQQIREHAGRVLWINWQAIVAALDAAQLQQRDGAGEAARCSSDMLADLRELMAMRHLLPFRGIGRGVSHISTLRPVLLRPAPQVTHRFSGIMAVGRPGVDDLNAWPRGARLMQLPSSGKDKRRRFSGFAGSCGRSARSCYVSLTGSAQGTALIYHPNLSHVVSRANLPETSLGLFRKANRR